MAVRHFRFSTGWSCACASWPWLVLRLCVMGVVVDPMPFIFFFSFWSFFLLPCLTSFSKVWERCRLPIFGALFFFGFTRGAGSVPSFSALSDSMWCGALP
jgi:hypothetical protein